MLAETLMVVMLASGGNELDNTDKRPSLKPLVNYSRNYVSKSDIRPIKLDGSQASGPIKK